MQVKDYLEKDCNVFIVIGKGFVFTFNKNKIDKRLKVNFKDVLEMAVQKELFSEGSVTLYV